MSRTWDHSRNKTFGRVVRLAKRGVVPPGPMSRAASGYPVGLTSKSATAGR